MKQSCIAMQYSLYLYCNFNQLIKWENNNVKNGTIKNSSIEVIILGSKHERSFIVYHKKKSETAFASMIKSLENCSSSKTRRLFGRKKDLWGTRINRWFFWIRMFWFYYKPKQGDSKNSSYKRLFKKQNQTDPKRSKSKQRLVSVWSLESEEYEEH